MAARWYYPKVGRFLSSDPAAGTADPRTPIDRERWLYRMNSPLDRSDPTGFKVCDADGYCFVPGKNRRPTPRRPHHRHNLRYVRFIRCANAPELIATAIKDLAASLRMPADSISGSP